MTGAEPPGPVRLHVLLHGYGATPADLAAIAPAVDPDHRFVTVAPRAPLPAGSGASWYDFDADWRAEPGSFRAGLSGVEAELDRACVRGGASRSDVVIGGFSQGAGMAAWLAFASSVPPAGLWCCGTIVEVDGRPLDLTRAAGTRVLLLAGRSDPNVPLERSRAQVERLRAAGAEVRYGEHEGGHGLSAPMLRDLREWLAGF